MKPVATKKTGAAPAAFVPDQTRMSTAAPRHGRHRVVPPRPSVRLLWPKGQRAQRELFDAWHQIAMQVLHSEKQSFRLMALIERFVNWKSGELWPTNDTLAMRAGGCGERTIKREVSAYQRLGLLQIELGWRQGKNKDWVRKRTIRLAIPNDFSGQIDGANRGPDEDNDDGANRGPESGANRGPDTLEATPEGKPEDRHAV